MFNKKGQSTLEYALITAVIIAGLLLMQHYMKHGYAGRLKSASDDIGEQYDPTKHTGKFQTTSKSYTEQTLKNRATTQKYIDLGDGSGAGRVQKKESLADEKIEAWGKDEDLYSK
ncbi:MAG: hypothetical protein KKC39_01985 [Candidatus Omnitrophica bacterium]|nr:hypothetical protein [Candidatus Omnitrophota bacterium]MBU4418388.1 hypothetical protein [Candidatus Omnitrophota bacterium]MBU4467503.1 hypothetical protein [Candidatus Omnitrophota bacterium]MCG2713306.1 hypothetical protein [Candidatus Omnitrophota bacterium]